MLKKALIKLIGLYKRYISPGLPPACKYFPTCSEYAMEAIEKRGVFVGTALAVWRILRCNPFSRGGNDPVPELREKKHGKHHD